MKTIKSYLPVFQGYYSTIFSSDMAEEAFLENEDLTFDEVDFDYTDYEHRVAEACISSVYNFLKHEGLSMDIIFEKVYSPREYNFENDTIYCTYKVSENTFEDLINYCEDNFSEFKDFLEEKYSSRSGFSSFFSIEPRKWFTEYLNDGNDKFERAFAGVIEFILLNEGYTVDDMLDDVSDEMSYIEILEA